MVTAQNLIYSYSSTARILGIEKEQIEKIDVWQKVVWVKVFGKRAKLISKRDFKQHFVEWRKSKSKSLQVTKHLHNDKGYTVRNPYKDTYYYVFLKDSGLTCQCEDFKNQIKFLGKGCCKHCYRVLSHLGYSSLRDYLDELDREETAA